MLRRLLVIAALVLIHAAPATAAESNTAASIARVLELTNAERAKVGVAPLTLSSALSSAAEDYSVVLATSGCFEHTCGPVPDIADRIEQAGYQGWTAIGENIAAGYQSPETVVAGWMASPGHRKNLLNSKYEEIGIGMAVGGGRYGTFWTQDFGARRVMPALAVQMDEALPPDPETAPPDNEAPPPEGE
jgi:uncharacterized protein YkwD